MQAVELHAELRNVGGKGANRAVRQGGSFPAIFYGPKRETLAIQINAREFLLKVGSLEGSHLIRLESPAEQLHDKIALVKETQHHPVTGSVMHADFYEVDMTAKLRVPVPLHFVGKAEGVVLGGILQPVRREVEVECFPTDIPEFIEVDVTGLHIHDAVHVSEISLPPNVDAIFDTDFAVVTVLPPTVEAPAGGAAEATAAGSAEGEPAKTETSEAKES